MERADFASLREALTARLAAVGDHVLRASDPTAHLETLRNAAARLDALVAGLPADCDPQLRHFLERQSFLKAVAWLDERLREVS